MKLFLYKSIVFLALVIALFKLLDELALSGLSKLKDDDYKDLALLYNNQIEEDMLILGSSRAWNHFNVKEIENTTNIKSRVVGLSGADYNMQRALWEHVLNSENKSKYIVHVVGALEFSKRKDGVFKKYKFFPFLENTFVSSNLSRLQEDLWKDKYIPLYKFHGSYKYFLKGLISKVKTNSTNTYNKYKGFRGFEDVWDGNINVDSKVISEYDIAMATSFIREEAQLSEDKGKILIIVYAPEYKQTNAIFIGKDVILENLKRIAEDFENVHFLNYNNWYGNSNIELFHNATHLNSQGAKVFSQTFSKDFLECTNQK